MRALLSHLGRYRSIGVFVEHVERLLERLQLVLPQLLVDVERRCKGRKKYGDEVAEKRESTFKMVVYSSAPPWGEFLSAHFAALFCCRRRRLFCLV